MNETKEQAKGRVRIWLTDRWVCYLPVPREQCISLSVETPLETVVTATVLQAGMCFPFIGVGAEGVTVQL